MDNIRLNMRFKSFNQPKVKAFTLAEVLMAKRESGKENKVLFSRKSKPKEPTNKIKKLAAFTLAEVLITLVIIGVVAALTIPSIVINYQKKQYVTQLKKTYTYLTNGFKTMMAQDGVTQLSDTKLWAKMPDNGFNTSTFLADKYKDAKDEFLKFFNVTTIYDENTIPDKYKISYKYLNYPSTSSAADYGIYLSDGASIYIGFYKELTVATCGSAACKSLKEFQEYRHTPTKFWQRAGIVQIDVNGPKAPNQWGRDMFYFMLGNDGNLYPMYGAEYTMTTTTCTDFNNFSSCKTYWKNNASNSKTYKCSTTSDSYGYSCASRIMEENWQMNY